MWLCKWKQENKSGDSLLVLKASAVLSLFHEVSTELERCLSLNRRNCVEALAGEEYLAEISLLLRKVIVI